MLLNMESEHLCISVSIFILETFDPQTVGLAIPLRHQYPARPSDGMQWVCSRRVGAITSVVHTLVSLRFLFPNHGFYICSTDSMRSMREETLHTQHNTADITHMKTTTWARRSIMMGEKPVHFVV